MKVTLHETGHFVALYAMGIYDEFTRITNQQTNYNGSPVYGLTIRNGASLWQLSSKWGEIAPLYMSNPTLAQQKEQEIKTLAQNVCLPHIVFFMGGGAMDRYRKVTDEFTSIDNSNIKSMVLPAMQVLNVSEDKMQELQDIVDAFLFRVFDVYRSLVEVVSQKLSEQGTLDKTAMDAILADWKSANPQDFASELSEARTTMEKAYGEWVKSVRG